MRHVKVNVEGYGTFEINADSVGELMSWLSRNKAVAIRQDNVVREVKDNNFTGRTLISE